MRISVHRNSPWFSPHSRRAKAFLDGVAIKRCYMADEELGKAWVHDTEAFKPGMGCVPTKELTGKVEVRLCKTF